jgi:hypothetical protein
MQAHIIYEALEQVATASFTCIQFFFFNSRARQLRKTY